MAPLSDKDSSNSISRDALAESCYQFCSIFFNLQKSLCLIFPFLTLLHILHFICLVSNDLSKASPSYVVSQNLAFVDHRSALGKVRCGPLCSFQDPSAWRHLRSWGTVVSVCWVGSASHWPLLTMSLLLIFSYFVCCLVPGDQATDGLVLYWWPAVHVEVRMFSNLFDKQVECLSVSALCTLPVFWFCRCLLLEPLQALC